MTSVLIPNSVTFLEYEAFERCYNLSSVTIGKGVTFIDKEVFQDCRSLTSLTFLGNITSIGEYAFGGCFSLPSFTIPSSVTSIGDYAFYGCSNLTSVTIPDNVKKIGWYAFSGCSEMVFVIISSGVTSINEQAFGNCPKLTDVFCKANNVPSTAVNTFQGSHVEYATLHVPANALNSYKEVAPWSYFGTLVELTQDDIDAIGSVKAIEEVTEVARYDIQGRMISKPQKGINIIRYSDGISKKVLVK